MIFYYTIKGRPKATPRPRATVSGRKAYVYNKPEYKQWLNDAAAQIRAQQEENNFPVVDSVCTVQITFVFRRTKQHMKKGDTLQRIPHGVKPDLDNLCKAAIDAAQQAGAITDDKLVHYISAIKLYGTHDGDGVTENPHTQIQFFIYENGAT